MIEFFQEGGFGMWPILFIGLVLVASAARYAWKPETRRLGFVGAMALALVPATVSATLSDLGTVFFALSHEERFQGEQRIRVLLEGLKECTRPGVFGAVVLTVAALLLAVGMSRRGRTEEA
jgi:hypothetical protein